MPSYRRLMRSPAKPYGSRRKFRSTPGGAAAALPAEATTLQPLGASPTSAATAMVESGGPSLRDLLVKQAGGGAPPKPPGTPDSPPPSGIPMREGGYDPGYVNPGEVWQRLGIGNANNPDIVRLIQTLISGTGSKGTFLDPAGDKDLISASLAQLEAGGQERRRMELARAPVSGLDPAQRAAALAEVNRGVDRDIGNAISGVGLESIRANDQARRQMLFDLIAKTYGLDRLEAEGIWNKRIAGEAKPEGKFLGLI